MRIDFPEHVSPWQPTPYWLTLLGRPPFRRINARWTVDHLGCRCSRYWEYPGDSWPTITTVQEIIHGRCKG